MTHMHAHRPEVPAEQKPFLRLLLLSQPLKPQEKLRD